ncbi:hypothetical protein [Ottowia sp.]|uniref:hypothetical protein n=1 Tax=Ottowia sp. TaxID=1898956 RepID=UPI0025F9D2C8|nr:hypothetical protein [Ottowia sp.]MBK6616681.1 hypothetical protein [Ottowia sp.]
MLQFLLPVIQNAYTGGHMKRSIAQLGLQYPACVTMMYLHGEPAEYIAAAVIAVNQRGE